VYLAGELARRKTSVVDEGEKKGSKGRRRGDTIAAWGSRTRMS